MISSLQEFKHFMTLDLPLRESRIRDLFMSTHKTYMEKSAYWSLVATRKKVIADFWCTQVSLHFLVILGITALLALLFYSNWPLLLMSLFIAGLLSLVTIFFFNYLPSYYADFLPKLDTIIAEQEKIQQDAEEMKKCKRTQFPIPALVIIYYIFSKTSSTPLLACNDHSARLLNNLFGADKDKLKQNLYRLLKLSSLSPKEKAEIQKGIDTARAFFGELDSPGAEKEIDILERKLYKV